MAIAETTYRALKTLVERGEIKHGCTLLEIGEANWYGDVVPDFECGKKWNVPEPFAIAKSAYLHLFAPKNQDAIDLDGTERALQIDLNQPIAYQRLRHWNGRFNLIINNGTCEHIFNIAQVFQTMHQLCAVGGLMIHESPFTGWVDHGFYCLQPTLFYDVAAANHYDLRYLAVEHIERKLLIEIECREHVHQLQRDGELPENSMLYVALRKTVAEPFKIPMQGVYAGALSEAGARAWKELR